MLCSALDISTLVISPSSENLDLYTVSIRIRGDVRVEVRVKPGITYLIEEATMKCRVLKVSAQPTSSELQWPISSSVHFSSSQSVAVFTSRVATVAVFTSRVANQ